MSFHRQMTNVLVGRGKVLLHYFCEQCACVLGIPVAHVYYVDVRRLY